MNRQQLNDLAGIVTTLDNIEAALPADIDAPVRHALDLGSLVDLEPIHDPAAILAHLGDRDAFTAAVLAAADAITRRKALTELHQQIAPRAVSDAWGMVLTNREQIVAAAAEKAAEHLDVLNRRAAELPFTLNPDNLDVLSTKQFGAWRALEPAAAAVTRILAGLAPLYRTGVDERIFNRFHQARMPLVAAPALAHAGEVYAFLDALEGRRRIGGTMGPANGDRGGFWPTRVAHLGGTFRLAGPEETARQFATLTSAAKVPAPRLPEAVTA